MNAGQRYIMRTLPACIHSLFAEHYYGCWHAKCISTFIGKPEGHRPSKRSRGWWYHTVKTYLKAVCGKCRLDSSGWRQHSGGTSYEHGNKLSILHLAGNFCLSTWAPWSWLDALLRENGTMYVGNKERQNNLHLWRVSRTDVSRLGLALHRVVRLSAYQRFREAHFFHLHDGWWPRVRQHGVIAKKTIIWFPTPVKLYGTRQLKSQLVTTPNPPPPKPKLLISPQAQSIVHIITELYLCQIKLGSRSQDWCIWQTGQ